MIYHISMNFFTCRCISIKNLKAGTRQMGLQLSQRDLKELLEEIKSYVSDIARGTDTPKTYDATPQPTDDDDDSLVVQQRKPFFNANCPPREACLSEFIRFARARDLSLRNSFSNIDENLDGDIGVDEVCKAFIKYGLASPSKSDVREFLRTADYFENHDGKVVFEEFRRLTLLFPHYGLERLFDREGEHWNMGYYSVPRGDAVTSPAVVLSAGAVAGFVSRTCTAPADRIKVSLQASARGATFAGTFRYMWKNEGVLSFWKGNGANVMKIAPESAFKFYANEIFKEQIAQDPRSVQPHERLLAGSAAGMVSQTIIYPMEVLKTRLALSQGGPYSSMASCLRTTVHNEGFGALYKGLAASNLGMIPYAGVDLAVCTNTTPCLLCDGVSAYVQPWFCGSNTRSNDVSCESI
eukprot:m.583266 g.583266  ORF g.583266 m.583266 type:complete len:410 (-) comp22338_c0_seq41:1368-2597(-)